MPQRVPPTAVATPRPLTTLATLPVGAKPAAVAVDPATHQVYVTNRGSNTLSVIDGAQRRVIATIPVGSQPSGIGVDSGLHKAFVASAGGDTLSVIDGRTNQVADLVSMEGGSFGVAADPITHRLYVTYDVVNRYAVSTGMVSVIDARSDRVLASAPIGGYGSGVSDVAVDPTGPRIYVTYVRLPGNPAGIALLDGAALHPVGAFGEYGFPIGAPGEFGLAVDTATHRVFQTAQYSGAGLVMFEGGGPATFGQHPVSVAAGASPMGIAVDPTTQTAYVADSGRFWPDGPHVNSVVVVDEATNQVVGVVPVGTLPWGVAVDPTTHLDYVANQGDNSVTVIAGPSRVERDPPARGRVKGDFALIRAHGG